MSKAPKDLRIPIMMSSAEVEAIDEWRFANKIATRAEAVRRLCLLALNVFKNEPGVAKSRDGLISLLKSTMARVTDDDDGLGDPFESLMDLIEGMGDAAFEMSSLQRITQAAVQNGSVEIAVEKTKQIQDLAAEVKMRIEAQKAKRRSR